MPSADEIRDTVGRGSERLARRRSSSRFLISPGAAPEATMRGRTRAPNMEHSWSRAGANGSESAQSRLYRKRLSQPDSVAYDCG